MKSKYSGQCPKNEKHTWNVGDEIFLSKSVDGQTWIKCNDKECFLSQGGKIDSGNKPKFVSNKFPITEAINIYKLSEELLTSFLKKREPTTISVSEQAIFIESMFRTLSGNFKP